MCPITLRRILQHTFLLRQVYMLDRVYVHTISLSLSLSLSNISIRSFVDHIVKHEGITRGENNISPCISLSQSHVMNSFCRKTLYYISNILHKRLHVKEVEHNRGSHNYPCECIYIYIYIYIRFITYSLIHNHLLGLFITICFIQS